MTSSASSHAADVQELDLFDALDLPEHVTTMQTLYWEAKREWQKLDAAYHVVLEDMLKRTGDLS